MENIFDAINIDDETWNHHQRPKTKQWTETCCSVQKEAKSVSVADKVMES